MTAAIALGRGLTALVDDADYVMLTHRSWRASSGAGRKPYAVSGTMLMHRLITDAPDGLVVDHINGDTLDNRRSNLRVCSHRENTRNKAKSRNGRGPFKGVSRHRNRWRASIHPDGRRVCLGLHPSAQAAARAYDRAATEHFGEFARLNFDPARDWIFVGEDHAR